MSSGANRWTRFLRRFCAPTIFPRSCEMTDSRAEQAWAHAIAVFISSCFELYNSRSLEHTTGFRIARSAIARLSCAREKAPITRGLSDNSLVREICCSMLMIERRDGSITSAVRDARVSA